MARPTRLLPLEAALESAQIDLLPFHIKHNGLAPISTYFQRRACPAEVAQGPNEALSSFRGRELHGTPVSLPAGFEGRVLRTSAPTLAPARKPRGVAPVVRKRPAVEANGAVAGRRTSPRKAKKAKMTHTLDSPLSSPVRSTRSSPAKAAAVAALAAVMTQDEPIDIALMGAATAVTLMSPAENEVEDSAMMLDDAPDTKVTVDLTPVHRFDTFTLWCPDGVPVDRGEDIYVRSLEEWVGLSHLIHAC